MTGAVEVVVVSALPATRHFHQPKTLGIACEQVAFVCEANLLRELHIWELYEGCLWHPIVIELRVLVGDQLHCFATANTTAG